MSTEDDDKALEVMLSKMEMDLIGDLFDDGQIQKRNQSGLSGPYHSQPARGGILNMLRSWRTSKATELVKENKEFVKSLNDYSDEEERWNRRHIRHSEARNKDVADLVSSFGAVENAFLKNENKGLGLQVLNQRLRKKLEEAGGPKQSVFEQEKQKIMEQQEKQKAQEWGRKEEIANKFESKNDALEMLQTKAVEKLMRIIEEYVNPADIANAGVDSLESFVQYADKLDNLPSDIRAKLDREIQKLSATFKAMAANILND